MNYITVEDLQTKFGTDWATADDFDLYAEQVNAWLYGNGIPMTLTDPIHQQVLRSASFFLARAAKENALYQTPDNIKSKKASAQSGTFVELQYAAYKDVENRWVKIAKDLLADWLQPSFVSLIHKIN